MKKCGKCIHLIDIVIYRESSISRVVERLQAKPISSSSAGHTCDYPSNIMASCRYNSTSHAQGMLHARYGERDTRGVSVAQFDAATIV
jgi:hypothetical protein